MDYESIGKPIFLVVLTTVLIYELWMYLKGKSSNKWVCHPAEVIDVGVNVRDDEGLEESKPYIKYEYTFNGTRFTGKRVAFGGLWSSNYGKSSKKISGIIKGKAVSVYINPKRPNQSVLHRGYVGNILLEAGLLLIVLAIAAKS